MKNETWFVDVISDLARFCAMNGLNKSAESLQDAQLVFLIESAEKQEIPNSDPGR